ncbi:MAG: hypothetical protein MZW92_12840 [Comamonadaceae bacterium]|nr:hypothetical protein [Comamonadaceae bacterium]
MALRNDAFESVEAALLVEAQATKAAILAQVRRFADAIVERERTAGAERDVLLVFLSGHGTALCERAGAVLLELGPGPDSGKDMERTGLSLRGVRRDRDRGAGRGRARHRCLPLRAWPATT